MRINDTICRLNPSEEEVENLKKEIDQDGDGEIEFEEFLELMNPKTLRWNYFPKLQKFSFLTCRQMQVVDDRESRIRNAFARLEGKDGKISKEIIINLVTVSLNQ